MFYTAVLCYCWSTPEQESRIAIGSVLGVLFFFFFACVWIIWESGHTWVVWRDGLRVPSPISRVLRALHPSRLRDVVVLFRAHRLPYSTNNAGSEHELAGRQDGVVGGEP